MIGLLGKDWGYTDAEGNKVSAFRDMFDGGGAGRYGDTFEGGPVSGLLNNLGVRPHGYRDRLSDRNRPVASRNPAPTPVATPAFADRFSGRDAVAPVAVNPVTRYDEAARFGLLAPAANVPYVSNMGVTQDQMMGAMSPLVFGYLQDYGNPADEAHRLTRRITGQVGF
jgi:hypothetical protein